jgi:NCAIR mutase (PurE)-related protein
VRPLLPGVKYQARARVLMAKSEDGALQRLPGTVGLVASGEPDAAAADLTRLLLQHLGAFVIAKDAASPGGLAAAAPALQVCDVVIALAGADGGLPAAVAELVDAPVLAVPAAGGAAPAAGAAPFAVTAADGGAAAALTAARMLRVAATRAMQIAEGAAAVVAHPQAAAAAAGEAAAHSMQ